jgi:hypothetical protein
MKVSDFFAELYVAGRFADAGWNVYFPRRDRGFDFIVSKSIGDTNQLIRPVQVKGKYPTSSKTDKATYGYIGELTETHPEMVLVIPFFSHLSPEIPSNIAFLPLGIVRPHSRGYRCEPCTFAGGSAKPRRDYAHFFDEAGLGLVEQLSWAQLTVGSSAA